MGEPYNIFSSNAFEEEAGDFYSPQDNIITTISQQATEITEMFLRSPVFLSPVDKHKVLVWFNLASKDQRMADLLFVGEHVSEENGHFDQTRKFYFHSVQHRKLPWQQHHPKLNSTALKVIQVILAQNSEEQKLITNITILPK
jgi:hypothetical protein